MFLAGNFALEIPGFELRFIEPADDKDVAQLVRAVMTEFGAVGEGFSINDPEVDNMAFVYSQPRSMYLVLQHKGQVVGGGGFGPLNGGQLDVCELRKMYFYASVRGLGLGRKLLEYLMQAARAANYTTCYIETMANMEGARRLYNRCGFRDLDAPMGSTGHCCACNWWMSADLKSL